MIRAQIIRISVVTLLLIGTISAGVILYRIATSRSEAPQPAVINTALIADLPQQRNSTVDTSHLAKDIMPPTNRWFSGIALNKDPKAVFPLPLSFKPSNSGFSFGLPNITSSANTISGGYNPAIAANLSATSYKVTRYDDISVTLTYYAAGDSEIGSVTIAEGSPFVSYVASQKQRIAVSEFTKTKSDLYVKNGNQAYAFRLHGGSYDGKAISLEQDQSVVWYAVPQRATAESIAPYAVALDSIAVSYSLGRTSATTTLRYVTAGHESLFGALPEHAVRGKAVGTYQTIYGVMQLFPAGTVSFDVPRIGTAITLDISRLTSADKEELRTQVQTDVAQLDLVKQDTYFGGKELYRAANLYALAEQLDDTESAQIVRLAIEAVISQWFDPKSNEVRDGRNFYYDTTVKGIVGNQTGFGSEQFNDHHFHYGYFLATMAILQRYDMSFAAKYSDFARLLAYDIAAPEASVVFPKQRVFDPYFGHSWAAGYGQTEDGNNQESSSEAVHAWNGLAAWSESVGDHTLSTEATWLLSREMAAAKAYWITPTISDRPLQSYRHQTVGINWGGKRDYATFFSDKPSAIFGIQLIPMPPVMEELRTDKKRIATNLSATLPDGNYSQQFGDYLLMYRSLIDKAGALSAARQLPDEFIDNGNTRSYMLAWIMSQ